MKKDKKYYMSLNYPIQIEKVDEGHLDIPYEIFCGMKHREELDPFISY
jgi:hypothetical protein